MCWSNLIFQVQQSKSPLQLRRRCNCNWNFICAHIGYRFFCGYWLCMYINVYFFKTIFYSKYTDRFMHIIKRDQANTQFFLLQITAFKVRMSKKSNRNTFSNEIMTTNVFYFGEKHFLIFKYCGFLDSADVNVQAKHHVVIPWL